MFWIFLGGIFSTIKWGQKPSVRQKGQKVLISSLHPIFIVPCKILKYLSLAITSPVFPVSSSSQLPTCFNRETYSNSPVVGWLVVVVLKTLGTVLKPRAWMTVPRISHELEEDMMSKFCFDWQWPGIVPGPGLASRNYMNLFHILIWCPAYHCTVLSSISMYCRCWFRFQSHGISRYPVSLDSDRYFDIYLHSTWFIRWHCIAIYEIYIIALHYIWHLLSGSGWVCQPLLNHTIYIRFIFFPTLFIISFSLGLLCWC